MNKQNTINYFAYGSNMPLARLQQRVPSAKITGVYFIKGYDLRFHMASNDGSAKCDAYYTNNSEHCVWGVVFEMLVSERDKLDKAESLGVGYSDQLVEVVNEKGEKLEALIYCALLVDHTKKPYSWYVNHVLMGAQQNNLPETYIEKIKSIEYIKDEHQTRALSEYSIYEDFE